MTLDPKSIANRLGAEHKGQCPETGGGAFGMARLAEILKDRLHTHDTGEGYGWVRTKVPMNAATEKLLFALAAKMSTAERRIDPLQLAAQIFEESVQKLAREQSQ